MNLSATDKLAYTIDYHFGMFAHFQDFTMLISVIIPLRTTDFTEIEKDRQTTLMRAFFQDIDVKKFPELDSPGDFCYRVPGVLCTDDRIMTLSFNTFDRGNYSIQYAPNTVKNIAIENANQLYTVDTRHFPREAVNVTLAGNEIFGTLELRTLPMELRNLKMSANCITGPIFLTMLPSKLEILNLSGNRIQQENLFFTTLPRNMKAIFLKGNKNCFKRIIHIADNGVETRIDRFDYHTYKIRY